MSVKLIGMGTLISTQIGIDEYLSNPAYEHSEYIDGRVEELHVGHKKHASIQARCVHKLLQYFELKPGGYVGTELHCRLKIRGETRFRLPDVAVVLTARFAADDYLEGAPDLAVEIRSPEDFISSQIRKFDDYFANGTKLGWLILPEEQSILVIAPNSPTRTVVSGEDLTGSDLLPELAFPADYLFG